MHRLSDRNGPQSVVQCDLDRLKPTDRSLKSLMLIKGRTVVIAGFEQSWITGISIARGPKVLPQPKTCSLPHAYGRVPAETPATPLGTGERR